MDSSVSEPVSFETNVVSITPATSITELPLPLADSSVSAGFPSPAEQEVGKRLDFNQFFIKHPAATFYVKVRGDSMIDRRIDNGDILLVDRALPPKHGDIVVARLHDGFCMRVLRHTEQDVWLEPANKNYKPIFIAPEMDWEIWGVVLLSIVQHSRVPKSPPVQTLNA